MPSLIADFCANYVDDHGPASLEELYEAAYAVNVTTAGTPAGVKQVLRRYSERFVQLPDERYDTAKRRLAGSILTHYMSYQRPERDWLWPGSALSPFQSLMNEAGSLPLQSGGSIRPRHYSAKVWVGPDGWIPELRDDELLGLRWTGDTLLVTPVSLSGGENDGDDTASRNDLVREVLKRHFQQPRYAIIESDNLTPTVLSALVEVPDLLSQPVMPLDDLLEVSHRRESDDARTGTARRHGHDGQLLVTLPARAKDEINRRAAAMDVPASVYSGDLLAAAVWRHEQPITAYSACDEIYRPYRNSDPFDQRYYGPYDEPQPYIDGPPYLGSV